MDKKYIITIDGRQSASDMNEKLSLSTLGNYGVVDGKNIIQYEESETTGFEGDITTLVVEQERRATLKRRGKTSSDLIIEMGQRNLCHYDTGDGALAIGVFAHRISNRLGPDGGELKLRYSLDVNANTVSTNELNITVRENRTNA